MPAASFPENVELVRWPAEREKRNELHRHARLRLLVVEAGADAPICSDIREDWVRAPITRNDLVARMSALRAKTAEYSTPRVDPCGIVYHRSRSVAVSPTETELLQLLAEHFGELVPRQKLKKQLSERAGEASRNALDLHIMRIRRRIAPIGLVMHTVRGRGYVLNVDGTGSAQRFGRSDDGAAAAPVRQITSLV